MTTKSGLRSLVQLFMCILLNLVAINIATQLITVIIIFANLLAKCVILMYIPTLLTVSMINKKPRQKFNVWHKSPSKSPVT